MIQRYKFIDEKKEHLHTLDNKPLTGVSSVVGVLNTPLAWWASGMAVQELGIPDYKVLGKIKKGEATKQELADLDTSLMEKLAEIKDLNTDEYLKLLDKAYRGHSKTLDKTAKAGTDLHTELEHWVKATMGLKPMRADCDVKIKPFIEWSKKEVKQFIASEAHCYSEKLWCGGITDAIAELKDGRLAIIDFKSAKSAYPKHFLQNAGYAILAEENGLFDKNGTVNKQLDKTLEVLIIVPFGAEIVEPVIRHNIKDWKLGFEQAVGLYRLLGIEKQN